METPIDLEALMIVKKLVFLTTFVLCPKILDLVGECFEDFISTKKLPNVNNSFMVVAMETQIDLEALLIVKRTVLLENLSLKKIDALCLKILDLVRQ